MLGLTNYTVGQVDPSISQIILYEDHGLEVQYKDRSFLQLSPCGANFKYTRPPRANSDVVPALARDIMQRCIFCTSETRPKVIQAILIRNQVCSPLYLPQGLLCGQQCMKVLDLYEDIKKVSWPTKDDGIVPLEDGRDACGGICATAEGAIVVTSKKGRAKLTLFPDRHRVLVTFLARMSPCETNKHSMPPPKTTCKQQYVWQDVIFPVQMCPSHWHAPLALAQTRTQNGSLNDRDRDRQSKLPQTLPLTCSKQFTHEWRGTFLDHDEDSAKDNDLSLPLLSAKSGRHCSIKMLWNDNATYWTTSKGTIEVWFSDGRILKSHPSAERSYTMLYQATSRMGSEEFQEKAVCASALPQHDVKIKSVVLRAMRLQMHSQSCHMVTSASQVHPCWFEYVNSETCTDTHLAEIAYGENLVTSDQVEEDTSLYEKVIVENVAVFSAIGDSTQIMFTDGALLHVTIDPSKLLNRSLQLNALTEGYCKLLYPDGRCTVLKSLTEPSSEATRYASHAVRWLEWLMEPIEIRRQKPFCSGSIHAPENANIVLHEIEKNRRFDQLLSWNSSLPVKPSPFLSAASGDRASDNHQPLPETISYRDVCDAMSKTSKAIDDIGAVIKSLS